jgi:addiction module RelE/StbE family toxin
MTIRWHKDFQKHYKKRILPFKNKDLKFKERVAIFINNPSSPIIKDHQLKGDKSKFRAFWIGGDLRISYKRNGSEIEFMDVGTHNQVY